VLHVLRLLLTPPARNFKHKSCQAGLKKLGLRAVSVDHSTIYRWVQHGVAFDGQQLFFGQKGLMGGPAPVRRFLPHLMDLVLSRKINPGKVFDLQVPIADVAEGYRAMDVRRAIKTLVRV
jgi:threonine dehydrogenase-like Zn-dependent dehydrogenase